MDDEDAKLRDIIVNLHYVADLLMVADRISRMHNCNDCGAKDCEYKPDWGSPVRYNCPFWRKTDECCPLFLKEDGDE